MKIDIKIETNGGALVEASTELGNHDFEQRLTHITDELIKLMKEARNGDRDEPPAA